MNTMRYVLLNISGLLSEFFGIVILFFFGMPYLIRTGGGDFMVTHPSAMGIGKEQFYSQMGWCGLALLVAGTGLQIWATWVNRSPAR